MGVSTTLALRKSVHRGALLWSSKCPALGFMDLFSLLAPAEIEPNGELQWGGCSNTLTSFHQRPYMSYFLYDIELRGPVELRPLDLCVVSFCGGSLIPFDSFITDWQFCIKTTLYCLAAQLACIWNVWTSCNGSRLTCSIWLVDITPHLSASTNKTRCELRRFQGSIDLASIPLQDKYTPFTGFWHIDLCITQQRREYVELEVLKVSTSFDKKLFEFSVCIDLNQHWSHSKIFGCSEWKTAVFCLFILWKNCILLQRFAWSYKGM